MGITLVLAEKPSVARDIARVLGAGTRGDGCLTGNGYTVTWALGHLVSLQEPDELDAKYKRWSADTLPILPEVIPLKVLPKTRDQFRKVKQMLNAPDTDRVICATDAGREGELIFRYIYTMAGCKKPFSRLWINSMTEEAIAEGFRTIQPGENYDGLYRSARCRSEADWLVGMNASRAFTLRYGALLSVGRVQTPTLALLVKRRLEIENFKPEAYATLTADFGDYKGICFSEKLRPDTHFPTAAEAQAAADAVKGRTARVQSAETSRKKELPPQLYDLTSLQRDANRLLGFTADKTLKLAQSLYEKHKALTYPRTDSRYLPPDMIPKVVQTLHALPESCQPLVPGALPDGKLPVSRRTVDASRVTDHHALIPTPRRANLAAMSEDERQLYDLVARRLLQAFYPAHEYDATRVITACEGYTFRSDGRVTAVEGWKAVAPLANPPKTRRRKGEEEPQVLPPLKPGDERTVKKTAVKEEMTKPPQPHTDASLLSAMENAGRELEDEELAQQMKGSGIGTPATRAAIIERLIQVGYAQRQGRALSATDKGVQLIRLMPDQLTSAEMTGRWELALEKITGGEQDADRFMESIRRYSAWLVEYAASCTAQAHFDPETGRGRRGGAKGQKTLAGCVCPLCGKGKVTETPLAFGCAEKGCAFTLWKDCLTRGGGPQLDAKLARLLLEKKTLRGSTGVIAIADGMISFTPNGQDAPGVRRELVYRKAR